MTDKKRGKPTGRKTLPPQPYEQEAEVHQIFSLMGLPARSGNGYINPRRPRLSLLEPTPHIAMTIEKAKKLG